MLQDSEINLHSVDQSCEKVKHWGSDCLQGSITESLKYW